MIKNIIFYIVLSALIISNIFLWVSQKKYSKTAFVKSQLVLEKYKGMNEVKAIYQKKVDAWKANYDSLEFRYNNSLQEYSSSVNKLSKTEKEQLEINLKRQEEVVNKYGKNIEEKAAEENEKLTQGVLNQVNDYIKRYAQQNGYELVLGVTLSGNILYGSEAIDITENIISGLNKEYKGQ